MPEWISVIWYDIRDSLSEIQVIDFAMPSYFLLWLIILMFPLTGVDRRDKIAASVYSLFCTAAGVALIYALPQQYTSNSQTIGQKVFTMMGMGAVGIFRWLYQPKDTAKEDAEKERLAAERAERALKAINDQVSKNKDNKRRA